MGIASLKRVTDLFIEGTEVVVAPGVPEAKIDPVIMWVNKLNAFESEEARRAGQVARSRTVLALTLVGTPEKTLFEAALVTTPREEMIESLVANKNTEWFIKSVDSLRTDPEWKERLEINERSREQLAGRPEDDPEVKLIAKINEDYVADLRDREKRYATEYRAELESKPLDDLQDEYRKAWADIRGNDAFTREFTKAQVFYALRNCNSRRRDGNGRWDHSECNHLDRSLDDMGEVNQLPQGLLDHVAASIALLNTPNSDARFSAGATSSSASAPSPEQEEASTPSTPMETSPVLATTSS